MQSNKSSLFQSSTCLSKKQLVLYHEHKLSAADTHAVERHLVDCELCSEALEGIALLPSMDMWDKVTDDIQKKYPVKEKEIPFYKQNTVWYAAASVALIAVFGWVINNYVQNSKQEVAALKVMAPQVNAEVSAPVQSDFAASDSQPLQMKAVPPVERKPQPEASVAAAPVFKQQAPRETVSGNAIAETEISRNADEVVPEEVKVTEEKLKAPASTSMNAHTEVLTDFAREKVLKDKSSNDDLTVLNLSGYKVFDYSYAPSPSNEKNAVGNAGVPAKYESREDMSKKAAYNSIRVKEVSYDNFLAGALNDYKAKSYSSALNKFQLILSDHPDDVNALFYTALSFEETKEYSKALNYLNKLDALPNKTFDQESQWHRALILVQTDKNTAILLLNTISNANGFYAKDAHKKLEEIREK
jgi:hypothetical protein